jgi:hypothetical protein
VFGCGETYPEQRMDRSEFISETRLTRYSAFKKSREASPSEISEAATIDNNRIDEQLM